MVVTLIPHLIEQHGCNNLIPFVLRLQFLSHFHQQLSKLIFTGSIPSISPERIIRWSLYKFSLSSAHEQLAEISVLGEFRHECFLHDLNLHLFPIFSTLTGNVWLLSKFKDVSRVLLLANDFNKWCTNKFLCLKKVLGCWPLFSIKLNWRWKEVCEFIVFLIFVVEINGLWTSTCKFKFSFVNLS